MRRFKILGPIVLFLSLGCTVGWYELRKPESLEAREVARIDCPRSVELAFSSRLSMDPMPSRPATPEYIRLGQVAFLGVTNDLLARFGCPTSRVGSNFSGPELSIAIVEAQKLRPLPQEILTGLTLGAIPSWGTRTDELRFEFSSDGSTAAFAVDEKRINHILLIPVSWLSFVLTDAEQVYEEALEEFLTRF